LRSDRADEARKFETFCYIGVMKDQRLLKTVMLGMDQVDRPRGRKWSDDIDITD